MLSGCSVLPVASLAGLARSCSELFRIARSNSVVVSCFPHRDLFIFAHTCLELLGATLLLPVAPRTGTYSYLLGVSRSKSVVRSCSPYWDVLIFARSCSELVEVGRSKSATQNPTQKSYSKFTNRTVYKVKTSKLENIVKPGQGEKHLCTRFLVHISNNCGVNWACSGMWT